MTGRHMINLGLVLFVIFVVLGYSTLVYRIKNPPKETPFRPEERKFECGSCATVWHYDTHLKDVYTGFSLYSSDCPRCNWYTDSRWN